MFFNSQHFAVRRMCWGSEMRTMKSEKWLNYSYEPVQTKQQVG